MPPSGLIRTSTTSRQMQINPLTISEIEVNNPFAGAPPVKGLTFIFFLVATDENVS